MSILYPLLYAGGVGASLSSPIYTAVAIVGLRGSRSGVGRRADELPPVTVLKPVCGLDHELYENLRSFCEQDYPAYQVVFGVRALGDPAIGVIKRIIAELPERDLALTIGGASLGPNHKVSNLARACQAARHAYLVIADSDMRVRPTYLRSIMREFDAPQVGAVTCLYTGIPAAGLASALGAAYINEWFLPSVLVALRFQKLRFCFGATMAVRRCVLEEIGGFAALAPYLADDYMLGKLVSEYGHEVRLSGYLVDNVVFETSLRSLFMHELRWARTVRSVRPVGYAFSIVTHAISVSLLFLLWSQSYVLAGSMVSAAVASRWLLRRRARAYAGTTRGASLWLLPLRDFFGTAIWAASFLGRGVEWRRQKFAVEAGSAMRAREELSS